ncbi:DNA glycosylase [Collybia nuda]|uniref:DNA-(apurinic or apyrimidinic site) lyase n=1 Tax=Collybia nuda TaxID=64659 RepID=A0A9P5YH33_9AGAR|nr:DNA glycosylase [Collybia nuda]
MMNVSPWQSVTLPVSQLALSAVLKCGQSFRWTVHTVDNDDSDTDDSPSPGPEYRLCLRDRVICLRQSPTTLFYKDVRPESQTTPSSSSSSSLAWLNDYFQLHIDLVALYSTWSTRDPVFAAIQSRFPGIRILRQDPWETLVSFICSSNNNISRITNMVHALCRHYSPALLQLPDDPHPYHPFPPPAALTASSVPDTLRALGFGYRANFIHRTAKLLVDTHGPGPAPEAFLHTLRTADTDHARVELLKFIGVGRKVADCVLLMSLDKHHVVPVDTHVHQIAVKHYGLKSAATTANKINMTPKLYDELSSHLFSLWGNHAGWAHSVLFTADLRSFSSYGLKSPTSPSASPAKRKRNSPKSVKDEVVSLGSLPDMATSLDVLSLAERVKRRRRA